MGQQQQAQTRAPPEHMATASRQVAIRVVNADGVWTTCM